MKERDIFISYVREDESLVIPLVDRLEVFGFSYWIDVSNLTAGGIWNSEINEQISQASVFLACLSKNWEDPESFVHAEVKIAFESLEANGRPKVLPLLMEECERPDALKHIQFIDFADVARSFPILLEYLNQNVILTRSEKRPPDELASIFENVAHFDPWTLAGSPGALGELLTHLYEGQTTKRSATLFESGDYEGVQRIWERVVDNEMFDINHQAWASLPFFLSEILAAKVDLSRSYFMQSYNTKDLKEILQLVAKGLKISEELVRWDPAGVQVDDEVSSVNRFNRERVHATYFQDVLSVNERLGLISFSSDLGMTEEKIADLLNRARQRISAFHLKN